MHPHLYATALHDPPSVLLSFSLLSPISSCRYVVITDFIFGLPRRSNPSARPPTKLEPIRQMARQRRSAIAVVVIIVIFVQLRYAPGRGHNSRPRRTA